MRPVTALTETAQLVADDIRGATVVAAHPDDEILWFSSVVGCASRTILCYSDVASDAKCSEGRRRVVAKLPLPNVHSIGLQEAEVYGAANWNRPELHPAGLAVRRRPGLTSGFSAERYERNFEELRLHLRGLLAGSKVVFSHSPWGEYGHEDHVQVFRAVESLRLELGFRLFFTTYVSARSFALFAHYLPELRGPGLALKVDPHLAESCMSLYRAHGCWTWFEDYRWPDSDQFVEWRPEGDRLHEGEIIPYRMITLRWRPRNAGTVTTGHGWAAWVDRLRAARNALLD